MTEFVSCQHAAEWLSLSLDGELSAGERQRLESHLQECSRCSALQADLGRQQRLLENELHRVSGVMEGLLAGRLDEELAERGELSTSSAPTRTAASTPGNGWVRWRAPLSMAASIGVLFLGLLAYQQWFTSDPGFTSDPVQDSSGGSEVAQGGADTPREATETVFARFEWDGQAPEVIREDGFRSALSAGDDGGRVDFVDRKDPQRAADPSELERGTFALIPGSRVWVPEESSPLRVAFADGSEARLEPGTGFVLTEVAGQPHFDLDQGRGRFRVTPGSVGMEVTTPLAIVKVIGTEFEVSHTTPQQAEEFGLLSTRSDVWVTTGEVMVYQKNTHKPPVKVTALRMAEVVPKSLRLSPPRDVDVVTPGTPARDGEPGRGLDLPPSLRKQ